MRNFNPRTSTPICMWSGVVPLVLLMLVVVGSARAGTIISESFETDGDGSRYTLSQPEFRDANDGYFMRSDDLHPSSQLLPSGDDDRRYNIIDNGGRYGGYDGDFVFVAEQMQDGGVSSIASVTFNSFSTVGITEPILFVGYFGAGDNTDGSPSYETNDYIRVTYDIGAGEVNALQFTAVTTGNNNLITQDTDFNGFGDADGTPLTATLQPFSFILPNDVPSITLRIYVSSNSSRDELAFDNIKVFVPEPGSLAIACGGLVLMTRRRSR